MTADGMVETWEEFETAVKSGGTVTCKPGLVFDMNDYYPEGMPSNWATNNNNIYGNGLVWKNIMLKDTNVVNKHLFNGTGKPSHFYDITFENVVSYGQHFFYSQYNAGGVEFHGCKMIGELYGKSASALIDPLSIKLSSYNGKGCLFDFKCSGQQILFRRDTSHGVTVEDSRLILDESDVIYSSSSTMTNYLLKNSLIEGYLSGYTMFNMGTNGTFASIVNAYHSDQYIGWYNSPTGTEKLVINLDKHLDGPPKTNYNGYGDKLILATTEQLKDAEFLRSKGFPIGR